MDIASFNDIDLFTSTESDRKENSVASFDSERLAVAETSSALVATDNNCNASGDDEREELGDFLWDALAGFDSSVVDLVDLCQQ